MVGFRYEECQQRNTQQLLQQTQALQANQLTPSARKELKGDQQRHWRPLKSPCHAPLALAIQNRQKKTAPSVRSFVLCLYLLSRFWVFSPSFDIGIKYKYYKAAKAAKSEGQ
jgi:hypothetical protein